MSKFEVGEYVVPLEEEVDDDCILKDKLYKVLNCEEFNGICKINFIDEEGDYRSRPAGLYRRMRPDEFRKLLSIREELERVKMENQANEAIIEHHVRRIQIMTREIDSLKHKLKTVHEVTNLIGGYE